MILNQKNPLQKRKYNYSNLITKCTSVMKMCELIISIIFLKSIFSRIGKVIGFVVTATIVVIVITIVCCCCCPFCILAKRKERGRVLRQGPPTQQQPQNPGVATQQGYALPTEQYQQQMAPQPYPNAGYNQQMPPSAVPYGNQGNQLLKNYFILFLQFLCIPSHS